MFCVKSLFNKLSESFVSCFSCWRAICRTFFASRSPFRFSRSSNCSARFSDDNIECGLRGVITPMNLPEVILHGQEEPFPTVSTGAHPNLTHPLSFQSLHATQGDDNIVDGFIDISAIKCQFRLKCQNQSNVPQFPAPHSGRRNYKKGRDLTTQDVNETRGDELRKWVLVESALRAQAFVQEFPMSSSCSSFSIYSTSSASSDSDDSDLTTPPDSPTPKVEDFDHLEDIIVILSDYILEDIRFPHNFNSTTTTDIASKTLNTRILC